MTRRDEPLPAPEALLPHDGPARLLERIVEAGTQRIVCLARVSAASPFVREGRVPAFVVLEMAAQSAAAWETVQRMKDGNAPEPRVGYVVSARDVEFSAADFPAEVQLDVRVELSGAAPPLTMYRFEVSLGERCVAAGTISTYITEERG